MKKYRAECELTEAAGGISVAMWWHTMGILLNGLNMRDKVLSILILFCSLLLSCQETDQKGRTIKADICILSGSEAGFTAALQAARLGKKVVLIEPTGHPGGMMVEGIVKDIRFGSARVIGGIARRWIRLRATTGKDGDSAGMSL